MIFLTSELELINNCECIFLYFYSNQMLFNKKMIFMLNNLQSNHKNKKFVAVDVDYFPNLCKRFNVTLIPTVIYIDYKGEHSRVEGIVSTNIFNNKFIDI